MPGAIRKVEGPALVVLAVAVQAKGAKEAKEKAAPAQPWCACAKGSASTRPRSRGAPTERGLARTRRSLPPVFVRRTNPSHHIAAGTSTPTVSRQRASNWCDADAYCLAAGKRLCGAIGGGATDYATDHDDADRSEWFDACSSQGMYDFPYGDSWTADQCVDSTIQSEVPGSRVSCQAPAPYDCVFDMSGNAMEWENSCSDDTALAVCRVRGGFYGDYTASDLACSADASVRRTGAVADDYRGVGFRCCLDCP